jgi:FkbM family methyltransferase
MENDLVYDLGLNRGDDTAYYLTKGYRVVAVDADPGLIEQATRQFGEPIREGRLTLLNVALASRDGEIDFHLSEQSLWNSVNREVSTRENLAVTTIKVASRRLPSLFREYGVPLYCKIDLEGSDIVCLDSLADAPELPRYISAESECTGDDRMLTDEQALATLNQLGQLGYKKFKLVDQNSLAVLGPSRRIYQSRPPIWERIGLRIGVGGYSHYNLWDLSKKTRATLNASFGYDFPEGASGPFGPDLGGQWMDLSMARRALLRHRRDYFRMKEAKSYGFWCDWHASL